MYLYSLQSWPRLFPASYTFFLLMNIQTKHINQHWRVLSLLSLHNLTRKLTPRANLRSIEYQDPRHNRQQRANAAQQTTRRPVAKTRVHLLRDEREHAT